MGGARGQQSLAFKVLAGLGLRGAFSGGTQGCSPLCKFSPAGREGDLCCSCMRSCPSAFAMRL